MPKKAVKKAAKKPKPPVRRPKAVEKRCYRQFCGLAKALDAIGERWTLLLVRDLLLGPRRFGDLARGLDGLAPNLLATRLKEMEAAGLVEKSPAPGGGRGEAYALTRSGRELEPALLALGAWGWRFLAKPDPDDRKELAWGLFSLKRRYRDVAKPLTAEIRADGRVFQYRLEPGRADLREGPLALPDFHLEGAGDAFRELFFRGAAMSALRDAGRLRFAGDGSALQGFLAAFGFAP